MPLFTSPTKLQRALADLALLAAIGAVMTVLGPFQTADRPLLLRAPDWMACMIGGGLIGVATDEIVRGRTTRFWPRLLIVSAVMSLPVTGFVWVINHLMFGGRWRPQELPLLEFQVVVVCFATMALRQLAWGQVEAVAAVEPANNADPLATFRQRLSARRRAAELIAVEAEDHYLRVHTDAGQELITARFGDALAELAAVEGFRTHRSWWVVASAIEDVKWLRGRGEARMKNGLLVPISRSQAAPLRGAGWF